MKNEENRRDEMKKSFLSEFLILHSQFGTIAAWMVLVLLSSVPVSAGQTRPELPSVAPIQAGPVSLYPTIILRDVGVDSNVFNDSSAPKEDFTFTVTPGLQAALRVGATRLIGTSAGDFVFYRTYKDQQSANSLFEGRFEVVSTRLRPFASAGRKRSRERRGFEIDARALLVDTHVMLGTDVELSAITALTAWVRRDKTAFAQGEQFLGVELGDQLDHTTQLAAAGAKFFVTPLTTLTVVAELQEDRFPSSPLRDTDSIRVAPTVEFARDAAINGRASAGYREFRPLDPRLPRYRGFIASVGAAYTLLGVTRFDVEANRDVSYSFDATEPFYLASGGRVTIAQRIAGPFDLIVLGGRQRLRYQEVGGALLSGRVETTMTGGGGVGVRIGELLRVTVTYDRTQRKSSEPGGREYERQRILGSLNYGL